jgi:hypothetical protein
MNGRSICLLFVVMLMIVWAASASGAGTIPEFRLFTGAYVPTGSQTDVLKASAFYGGQVAVETGRMFHLVGTFGYGEPRTKGSAIVTKVRAYFYDAGAEVFHTVSLTSQGEPEWLLKPFLGAGVGARTYDLKGVDSKAHTDAAGYGAVGTEIQHTRVAARIEVRDYLTRFKGFTGEEKASTRNDLGILGGLVYHF